MGFNSAFKGLNYPQCQSKKLHIKAGSGNKFNIVNIFNYESPTRVLVIAN